jgi:hypothetical protein
VGIIVEACWKGYKQAGLKKKGDRMVPNCVPISEDINIPINVGDTLLGGKFKNKRIVVKSIDKNEKGDITINGKPLLKFRMIQEGGDVIAICEMGCGPRIKGESDADYKRRCSGRYTYAFPLYMTSKAEEPKEEPTTPPSDSEPPAEPPVETPPGGEVAEAQAVSGSKIHKFITGKNLTLKGKKYPDIEFEVISTDNKSELVKLRVLSPKNLFGQELNVPFKTIRRGPFIKTQTKGVFETIKKVDGKYVVYPKSGGDRLGTHDTYKDALKQLQAIEASKARRNEDWSDKYKRSIDCNNPKGFSQKAHCQGRKKNESLNEITVATIVKKSDNFKEFVKEFYKEYKDFPKDRDTIKWLSGIYTDIKDGAKTQSISEETNEDLRKWFGKGKTGSSGGGGWDRYGSDGQKLGKCGDGDDGDAYAACLSKEKAAKLGPEGRAAFVRRKRADQKKAGDAKKGGEQKKGQKPTFSKTGASEGVINENNESPFEIMSRLKLDAGKFKKFIDDNKLDINKVYQYIKKPNPGFMQRRFTILNIVNLPPKNAFRKRVIKMLESTINEIPMADLQKIDQFADKQLNPLDVVITDKHFFDRLNDPRNGKEISQAELIGFFKRLGKNKKQFLDFLDKYQEMVAVDDRTNINIPFMKQANKAIAKTIMRKKDFKSFAPKLDI